jgi:transcriptional regulator with XRE-family HTH domain
MTDQDIDRARSLVPHFLADRLRSVLARRRLSQRQLADATGIPQATLATYLAGRVAMPAPALLAISRATGADPGWLLCGGEHRLDMAALSLAALKAAARTKAFDTSSPQAEKALAEALIAVATEYGAACNFVWTGAAGDDNGHVTFQFDLGTAKPSAE